jgi:hypothetical protein
MKTMRATEAKMDAVDQRLIQRLRSRGYVVERAAGPDHLYREYNDHGNTCHAPGCELAIEDHYAAELAAELATNDRLRIHANPCASFCSDPAAHAEGAHDV